MRRVWRVISFLLALGVSLAQSDKRPTEQPTVRLAEVDTIRTEGLHVPQHLNSVKCDSDGNVYVRFEDGFPSGPVDGAPVVRISPHGKQELLFDSKAVPGRYDWQISDYSILDGYLYELGSGPDGYYLVRFNRGADLDDTTELKLDSTVLPWTLVVLRSDKFLILGSYIDGPSQGSPFNGVFSEDGSLVNTIALPGDSQKQRKQSQSGGRVPESVSMGEALAGEDGTVYVMRSTYPTLIHVISSSGDLLRTLKIQPPRRSMRPVEFKVAGNRLAVEYSFPSEHEGTDIILVVDGTLGYVIASYVKPSDLPGIMSCYLADNRFVFIGNEGNHPKIIYAMPR